MLSCKRNSAELLSTITSNLPLLFTQIYLRICVCRQQSLTYGTKIFTETVTKLDLLGGSPFKMWTDSKAITANAVIIATGAAAKRLKIPGTDEETGFWNKGISACAVCDGSSPLFRYVTRYSSAQLAGGYMVCTDSVLWWLLARWVAVFYRHGHACAPAATPRVHSAHRTFAAQISWWA